ncbi:hypothetical protein QE152_g169 [Popillia japonica]|uniref:Transposase n=1 Tax=Popillia japonica TaxID=7064 RepID=A0AAW1NGH8_POPJA
MAFTQKLFAINEFKRLWRTLIVLLDQKWGKDPQCQCPLPIVFRTYKKKTEVKPFTPELFRQAQELMKGGLSIRRAAKELGFKEATVRNRSVCVLFLPVTEFWFVIRLKKGYGAQKLGRFRSVFSNQEDVEIVAHCKELNKKCVQQSGRRRNSRPL